MTMLLLKRVVSRVAPAPVIRWLKKAYYPRVVRSFPASRWPGAQVVRQLVRTGDSVVDVGANIGYVSALLAGWVGPTGAVHAFEPVPETFDLLQHNLKGKEFRQVSVYPYALSSKAGEVNMAMASYPGGGRNLYESRVISASEQAHATVKVQTRPLDALASAWDKPVAFMKIDVEGHELEVIRGSDGTLRRDQPALYIEVTGDPDDLSSSAAHLFALLGERGYVAHLLDGGHLRLRHADDRATDYFFLAKHHLELLDP